jgi:outer membrane receptor for ferrienterochelin and colicin
LRYIEDRYALFDYNVRFARMEFNSRLAELKYEWKLSNTFTLTPKFNFKWSEPWTYPFREATWYKTVTRYTAGLEGAWNASPRLDVVLGVQGYQDRARTQPAKPWNTTQDLTLCYRDQAVYAEALWQGEWATITLGGRFESHSAAGDAFVPRLGITKAFDRFHFKVLAAQAFRTPTTDNFDQATVAIHPEKTTAYEVEMGYRFTPNFIATVNLFTQRVKDPLVWTQYPDGEGTYQNLPQTGSRGAECTLAWRYAWGFLNFTGSYYEARQNQVSDYAVPWNDRYLIASARTKATLYSSFFLGNHVSLAPSLVVLGPRYGYPSGLPTSPMVPIAFKSTAVGDLFLHYGIPRWDLLLSAGVSNLTNEKQLFLGAYPTSMGPMPGPGREFTLRVGYNF